MKNTSLVTKTISGCFLMGLWFWANASATLAQGETIEIKNALSRYRVVLKNVKCRDANDGASENECHGPIRVELLHRDSGKLLQVINMSNVSLNSEAIAYNAETNRTERVLYDDEYSFIADDFNFDGDEDLAICNGRNGGYGGPSYNVFLFDPKRRRFVENKKLTGLAEGAYLGLFRVDRKRKALIASSKSGCCYHETEIYQFIRRQPTLVEKIVEDATGGMVVTTRSRLRGGKWVRTVRRSKIER